MRFFLRIREEKDDFFFFINFDNETKNLTFPQFSFIFTEAMTKTSSEVQQQGDRIIKTTTTEGEGRHQVNK